MTTNSQQTISDTFCPYPWIHSYLGCSYERKLCCISDDLEEFQKVPTEQFWNSYRMKSIRKQMINGEEVSICHKCYDAQRNGITSLREEILSHTQMKDTLKYIEKTDSTGFYSGQPNYFDYRTLQCNLQCVSCGGVYSSKHKILFNKMWGGEKEESSRDIEFEHIMGDEIVESIRNKTCDTIYWAGGEPMISLVHWKVMDEISKLRKNPEYENYINNIHIHYNTNLTQLHWKSQSIPHLIALSKPSIQASLDGTNETIEYTRDGVKWETIKNNWKYYHKTLHKRNKMGVASVLSSPVIMDIDRWFDFFEPYDPHVYNHQYFCSPEYYPETAACFLDVKLFPKHIFDRIINHAIERFRATQLNGAIKSIEILKAYINDRELKADFYNNMDMIKEIKKGTIYRDKFLITKRPYHELLKIIDTEAYEWYMSINIEE